MNYKNFAISVSFFYLIAFGLFAEDTVSDKQTGVTFPKEISIESKGRTYQLQATGVSTRKKFFVKIYSIASYLQVPILANENAFQEIMQNDKAHQLTLKWVYAAPTQKVKDGYVESFKNVLTDQDYTKVQSEIDQFIGYFNQDIKKGDEHILRWLPGGYIEVLINSKSVGKITNQDFATALWSIWFGKNSVVDRDQLVSLMK